MFSQFTKLLANPINILKPSVINTAKHFYAGLDLKTPNQFPFNKEYPKKLCKQAENCCDSNRIARDPCNRPGARENKLKTDMKLERRLGNKTSAWEFPAECCGNPCPDLLPRFDTLYYAPTDKAKRQYQQTWVECPRLRIRKRKVCCYEPTTLPPIYQRKKAERSTTACEFNSEKLKQFCKAGGNYRCPTIQAPCCIRGRKPPGCYNPRGVSDCTKKCCPYPSFSECCHPCPKPTRPAECLCHQPVPLCEMYRFLNYKQKYNLPPPLPAWPPKTC